MNTAEAIKALARGEKIRAKGWPDAPVISLEDIGIGHDGCTYRTVIWELYQPPKRYAESVKDVLGVSQVKINWPGGTTRDHAYYSGHPWNTEELALTSLCLQLGGTVEIIE